MNSTPHSVGFTRGQVIQWITLQIHVHIANFICGDTLDILFRDTWFLDEHFQRITPFSTLITKCGRRYTTFKIYNTQN